MQQQSGDICDPAGAPPPLTPGRAGDDGSPEMLVFAAVRFEHRLGVLEAISSTPIIPSSSWSRMGQ